MASSFAKVTATTSMTNHDRRTARKMAKLAAKGVHGPDPPPTQPRREGLRGKKLAFFPDKPPQLVVPRNPQPTQPNTTGIPGLEGQEDIPNSDSESEQGFSTVVPLGQQVGHSAPDHIDDDAQSDASTVIENDDSDAPGSDEEGIYNSGARATLNATRSGKQVSSGNPHSDGDGNAATASATPSGKQVSSAATANTTPSGKQVSFRNPHSERDGNAVAADLHHSNVPETETAGVVSAPHAYLVAQPTGQAITFLVLAQHFPFNPPFNQPTHPFGVSPVVSNTLADLSSEDLDLLNSSFPGDAGYDVFGEPTNISMHSTGVGTSNGMFSTNPLGFAAPNSGSQLPNTRAASTDHNVDFNMHNTVNGLMGGMAWDPQAPDQGLVQGTEEPAASATNSPASLAPGAGLAPTVPHPQSHGSLASQADKGLSIPHDESNNSILAHPHPHLQVATPRRSVSAPQVPGNLLPNNSHALTSTSHSSRSYSPALPANQPPITPRLVHRGGTPSASSQRAALLVPLPPTPRAFGPNPLARSFSTPSRRNTPAVSSFRPLAHLNLETASPHSSHAGTPCPASSCLPTIPSRRPPFQGNPSTPSTPHASLPASPWQANTPHPPFSPSPAHSLRQASPPPSPSVPHEQVDALGSPIAGGALPSDFHPEELGGGDGASDFGENPARGQPVRHHRVRTPPPLAQAFTRTLLLEADTANLSDDDMIVNRSEVASHRVQLVAPVMSTTPSTVELAMNKAKEVQAIRKARKSNEKADTGSSQSGERVSSLSTKSQEFMAVVKAYMLWEFVAKAPWPEDEDAVVLRAKDFASANTELLADQIFTDAFHKMANKGSSAIRGRCHPVVLQAVKTFYDVSENTPAQVNRLLARGRFLYPDDRMVASDIFNVALIGTILVAILFPSRGRPGIVFMDQLLRDDDAEETEALLDLVAVPGPGGTCTSTTFADSSPEASRGAPIAALAYACILIHHALERLTSKGQRKEFHRNSYGDLWAHYVRELVQHPHLGKLRNVFMDMIK